MSNGIAIGVGVGALAVGAGAAVILLRRNRDDDADAPKHSEPPKPHRPEPFVEFGLRPGIYRANHKGIWDDHPDRLGPTGTRPDGMTRREWAAVEHVAEGVAAIQKLLPGDPVAARLNSVPLVFNISPEDAPSVDGLGSFNVPNANIIAIDDSKKYPGELLPTDVAIHELSHAYILGTGSAWGDDTESIAINEGLADAVAMVTTHDRTLGEDYYSERSRGHRHGIRDAAVNAHKDNVTGISFSYAKSELELNRIAPIERRMNWLWNQLMKPDLSKKEEDSLFDRYLRAEDELRRGDLQGDPHTIGGPVPRVVSLVAKDAGWGAATTLVRDVMSDRDVAIVKGEDLTFEGVAQAMRASATEHGGTYATSVRDALRATQLNEAA